MCVVQRGFALLALLGALVLVAAGCGGDDGDDQEPPGTSAALAWADDFCSLVTAWTDELERIGRDVADLSSLSRDTLRDAAADAEDVTDSFLDDVRDLGEPETESGDEAEALIDDLVDTLESEKQRIEDAIDDISGITGITSAVSTVAGSLTTMLQELERTFDELRELDATGELESAFEDAPACDELTSS